MRFQILPILTCLYVPSLISLAFSLPSCTPLWVFSTVLEHSSSRTFFPSMHHSLSVHKSYSHMFAPLQFFSIRASCFAVYTIYILMPVMHRASLLMYLPTYSIYLFHFGLWNIRIYSISHIYYIFTIYICYFVYILLRYSCCH